jgi:hypothetical protein
MIILDLDGVFADFTGAAAALHGKWGTKITKWDFFLDWGLTPKTFWAKINAEGEAFYRDMVLPYPWAEELLLMVQEADDFIFMSNPACGTPTGYASKKLWVDKYLQPLVVDEIKVIAGSEKHLLAGKDRVLIDDYDVNIKKFREHGGYGIAFPQLWNAQRSQASKGLMYTKIHLQAWRGMQLRELREQFAHKKPKRVFPSGDSPGY